ncbi:MAG TPA: hypothetical protein VNA68_02850 [Candidatus Dormibacteraeota bacterium]|nr:hypothetical protein [Candidatus Dormibacteraeota bacterium]
MKLTFGKLAVISVITTIIGATSGFLADRHLVYPGERGPKGEQGMTGAVGSQGTVGLIGEAGPQGPQGSAGTPGPTGLQGSAGPQGEQGLQGSTGPTGATGATGAQGPSGTATCPNGTCVSLQATSPGVQETGNINVSGTIIASTFSGSGASLTSLNATNISSGTLADGRLSANVSLLGQTIENAELAGSISDSKLLTISTAGKVADSALSSNVTIQGNTFNGVSQLVQLNASTQLPAVSGVLLTSLNATQLTSGTVDNARLNSSVSLLGQLIENAELAGSIADSKLNTISTAGKVADSALSSNVALLSAANTFSNTNSIQKTSTTAFRVQNDAGATTYLGVDTSAGILFSSVADGASAVGFKFNTSVTYSTAGAKLLSVSNNGAEKFAIDKDGRITTASVNSASIVDGSVTSADLAAQEAWHEVGAGGEPAFLNTWTNYGGNYATVAFRKDHFGIVHLRGVTKSGTMNTGVFALPVGYRPAAWEQFQLSYGGNTSIEVQASNGQVVAYGTYNGFISLSGITFQAAP